MKTLKQFIAFYSSYSKGVLYCGFYKYSPKYTSKYHAYQIKKICLPVELQEPYESICEKTNQLNKALQQNELEIECLNECFNEFPSIRFQIELLIQKERLSIFTSIKSKRLKGVNTNFLNYTQYHFVIFKNHYKNKKLN